ncbi:RagB/SusD family nutrient uptake outer membrane protein [uncultured Mucilaginibacter sp.]|uniref:RagB/SusD family nutrient uptake outer membrane protein n=1 Tax=uncultured Mucilaginibacter sp. TaxID=797541 RepID=UPI00262E072C|nr:RagB/SusD family nutrient uptake outer membrane protein [uncultured Mucilaginibacter sp.]
MKFKNKNTRYIIQASILSLTLSLTTSCKKNYLDTVPVTSFSPVTAFNTPARMLAQINALYEQLKSGYLLGGRYEVYGELRADDFINAKSNAVTGLDTWNQNVNSGSNEVKYTWQYAYIVINSCNVFLQGLSDNPNVLDATTTAQYAAEAKFVRAYAYLLLVQLYAQPFTANNGAGLGLPLRLKAESGTGDNNLARSTVAQVYQQILSDLNTAEAGLPLAYTSAALNTSRAQRNTAVALKTRVYLNMGDYANVIKEASKIVTLSGTSYQATSGVNNKLETSDVTVFNSSYTGPEAILTMIFTPNDQPGSQFALGSYYTPGTEYWLNPTATIADPVYSSTTSTDTRKSLLLVSGGHTYLNKWKTSQSPFTDYIPVIRYAEIMLNYAEAAARTGDLVTATSLLNAVRHRSDPTYVFSPTAVSTQAALVNTILAERRIELLGEGFKSFDLMRLQQPLPAKSGPPGNAPTVAPTAPNYIWPISGDELALNKLCQPNP